MTQSGKDISRRSFLNIAITAVVVGVVAGVGGYYAGLMGVAPSVSTVTQTGGASVSTATITSPTTVTTTVPTTITTTVTSTTTTSPTTTTAPKPDKITVMTWGGPAADNLPNAMGAFTQQYSVPAQLELQAMSSEGLAKIATDWPRVNIDAFNTIPAVLVLAKNQGFVTPFDETDVPNLADVPENLKIKLDGKIYGVPGWYNCTLWQWNHDRFPKGLKGINDLLDPGLKGRIAAHAISSYAGGFIVQLAYSRGGDERNMEGGWQFMKELAEGGYIKTVQSSDAQTTDSMLREEVWAAWSTTANLKAMMDAGGPISATKIYTDSKTAMDPSVWAIVDGPKREWACRFLNTLLDPEVLHKIIVGMGTMPSNKKTMVPADIASRILSPTEAEEHGYFINPEYQANMLPQWKERWEKDIVPLLG
jgi:putative spermidine/putrescine transport system substrate-binding protein